MKDLAAHFQQPMVPADFGYSARGALSALAVALGIAALLYAFVAWPGQTAVWLGLAALLRFVGRHPIATLMH